MSVANTSINQSSVTPSDPNHNPQVNPANTSELEKSRDAVDGATSPKSRTFQPPAWTVPQSPRLLQQGVGSDSKIPKTPDASAVLTSTPPKLVARPSQDDSSSMTRTRSGSSPASLSSPSAGLAQTLATQTAVVPPLNLQQVKSKLADHCSVTPGSSSSAHRASVSTLLKAPPSTPTKFNSPRASLRVQLTDAKPISTSAPSTPRKSQRATQEYQPLSVRHSIKSPGRDRHTDLQPIASPRKVDQEFLALADEVATHCINAMLGTDSKEGVTSPKHLRESDVKTLLRGDLKIPVNQLSPELRARLPKAFDQATITHSALIHALYGQSFAISPAGKSLSATRKSVMDDYSNKSLTIKVMASWVDTDPEAKQRYLHNMEDRAVAYANFTFGGDSGLSPSSMISPELLQLWRTMDQKLCAHKPGRAERERLAFDLILTREVLPAARGDDSEAELAIPALFFTAIKQACMKVFPAFRDQVLQMFDNERDAPTSTVSPYRSTSSSHTSSNSSTSSSSREQSN